MDSDRQSENGMTSDVAARETQIEDDPTPIGDHERNQPSFEEAPLAFVLTGKRCLSLSSRISAAEVACLESQGRGVEVIDDFVRNFLVRHGLLTTLDCFENEWSDLCKARGRDQSDIQPVSDQYALNNSLEDEIKQLRQELQDMRRRLDEEEVKGERWRKERDVHRLHHKRIAQEKKTLLDDVNRLKIQSIAKDPELIKIRKKHDQQLKENAMLLLEKDKLQKQLESLVGKEETEDVASADESKKPLKKLSSVDRTIAAVLKTTKPSKRSDRPPLSLSTLSCRLVLEGHQRAASRLARHPTKRILASVSDDRTWKLWDLAAGDCLFTGFGHRDWIAGVDFHPSGNEQLAIDALKDFSGSVLATSSGDGTVKLWDYERQSCLATLNENQAVWSVAYHASGDILATASLGCVARLWDVADEKCPIVFRGHTDSVNAVAWHPDGQTLCSASSDKTICLWDARTGRLRTTLIGHNNSCNDCSIDGDGSLLVSCDADGITKTWDLRTTKLLSTVDSLHHRPTNACIFDGDAQTVVVADGDGCIRSYDASIGVCIARLDAHDVNVLSLVADDLGGLFTADASGMIKAWSETTT